MTLQEYKAIESYMLSWMDKGAHDHMHVYRVLYAALDIAETEPGVDMDILMAACLLHDIGRERQNQDLELCHAEIGGEMAYAFLLERGWPEERTAHVGDAIRTHRYRRDYPPATLEAKILFDADKLDVTGAMGVARTLQYEGQIAEPLYLFDEDGAVRKEPTAAEISTFFQEFNYKLRVVYDSFHTARARELAQKRRQIAFDYYDALLEEVEEGHSGGARRLKGLLT